MLLIGLINYKCCFFTSQKLITLKGALLEAKFLKNISLDKFKMQLCSVKDKFRFFLI